VNLTECNSKTPTTFLPVTLTPNAVVNTTPYQQAADILDVAKQSPTRPIIQTIAPADWPAASAPNLEFAHDDVVKTSSNPES
jgi:hypothetical protein